MSEYTNTNDVWNDDGDESRAAAEKREGKKGRLRRFLLVLLVLLLALAAAVISVYRDGNGLDGLRRFFSYGSSGAQGATEYRYESAASNRFAALGDVLAVLSESSLRLLAPDGSEIWSAQVKMTAPEVRSGGNLLLAYDVGGTELYLLDKKGEKLHLTTEEPILSATLNRKGMLAVTAEEKNCKGSVSVYDAEQQKIFAFRSSRRFVTNACVSDNGKTLAAVTLGQEGGAFISSVVLYDLKKTDPVADYDLTDALVVDLDSADGKFFTVSDTALSAASADGALLWTYAYPQEYLRGYDFGGENFTALLLNRYRSGSVGRIVTVDRAGQELGSLDVAEEIRAVSACGKYLAVLYADRLVVYRPDFTS
ncbi:MAG: hypothetical protein IKN53_01650, partial [Oscillibacter sp.]|nr:hypothetical protein [Oscillibacter sp.]